jgi:hypothetical protein
MIDTNVEEDRRLQFVGRREADHSGVCANHALGKDRLDRLEEEIKKLPKMNMKISIGMGVVISAVCIATVLFGSVDSFKSETMAMQTKHELFVSTQYERVDEQVKGITKDMTKTTIQVAALTTEVKYLRLDIKELTEAMTNHLDYDRRILHGDKDSISWFRQGDALGGLHRAWSDG